MKKGIIFDLDGTLVDSLDFWNHLGEEFLKTKGIIDKDIDKECYNMTIEEAAGYMKVKHNLEDNVSFIRMLINCLIEEKYFKTLKLNPGVADCVEYLAAHGYSMIVATDTPKPLALAVLKKNGIAEYFVDVITTIKVKKGKDFPDIYDYCTLRMGLSKDEVVVFEDDQNAINTLKKACYDVIGYGDNLDTTFKISSFEDDGAIMMVQKMI